MKEDPPPKQPAPNPALQNPNLKHQHGQPGLDWVNIGPGPRGGNVWEYRGKNEITQDAEKEKSPKKPPEEPTARQPHAEPTQDNEEVQHSEQEVNSVLAKHQDKTRAVKFGDHPAITTVVPQVPKAIDSLQDIYDNMPADVSIKLIRKQIEEADQIRASRGLSALFTR